MELCSVVVVVATIFFVTGAIAIVAVNILLRLNVRINGLFTKGL